MVPVYHTIQQLPLFPEKQCTKCLKPLPATTEYFYTTKKRNSSLIAITSVCKKCHNKKIPNKRYVNNCQRCGNPFSTRTKTQKCCSRNCSAALLAILFKGEKSAVYRGDAIAHTCLQCGKTFRRSFAQGSPKPSYCSRNCMALAFSNRMAGPGNPAWRGGKWPYKGRYWKMISKAVLIRDKVCQYCGGIDDLVAHHLIPQRYWLSLEAANVMSNLTACCHDCHVRRPEHYWVELPDEVFDPTLHSRLPMPRTTTKLVPKPPCKVCGKPVTWASNECCSLACASKLKWERGKCDNLKGHRPGTMQKHTFLCAYCGETSVSETYSAKMFCSRACYTADKNDRAVAKAITEIHPCDHCGQTCKKEQWRMSVSKTGMLFCSDVCRDAHRCKRVTVTCPVCHKQFEVQAYRVKDGKQPTCSQQCAGKYAAIKRNQP